MFAIRSLLLGFAALLALGLAGCATAPEPGSIGEQLWFDQAQGYDIHKTPPDARVLGAVGYPRTDFRIHRPAFPLYEPR